MIHCVSCANKVYVDAEKPSVHRLDLMPSQQAKK